VRRERLGIEVLKTEVALVVALPLQAVVCGSLITFTGRKRLADSFSGCVLTVDPL
jgi:hypothetical protein